MSGNPENWRCGEIAPHPLAGCKTLIQRLFTGSGAADWGLRRDNFELALSRSANKRFSGSSPSPRQLEEYLTALHVKDLALACACAEGHTQAWDFFVSTYREYLRRAAAAILRCSATSPAACDLADSLFAELYGLSEGKRSDRSLFRYFHGRSSLKTWLRAVLAQRHIDGIRASRRFRELPEDDHDARRASPQTTAHHSSQMPGDPHRERYVALFTRTLGVALGLLESRDKERLRLYYAEELTLAEIARRFGEHESSVSRKLERTRRELRLKVEQVLRKGATGVNGLPQQPGLSEEEISLCFAYAAEDVPIDFDKVFPQPASQPVKAERKEP